MHAVEREYIFANWPVLIALSEKPVYVIGLMTSLIQFIRIIIIGLRLCIGLNDAIHVSVMSP